MARFCTNCGSPMDENASFCSKCGQAVAGATAGGGSVASVPATGNAGIAENVAGLLAYLLIPAIVFLLVEPYNRNRFIRFHSFQCIFLAVFLFALHLVLGLIPLLGWIVSVLIGAASLVLWIVLMAKAYGGQMWKLPIVGEMAEKQANAM